MRGYSFPEGYGKTVKLRLISNNLCYGPAPRSDEEVEQRLTILENGQVYLSRYWFGTGHPYQFRGLEKLRVTVEEAEQILRKAQERFENGNLMLQITDIGTWNLELMDEGGQTAHFSGSTLPDEGGLSDLSFYIRQVLNLQNFFLFDCDLPAESILLLELDYRSAPSRLDQADNLALPFQKAEEYCERLLISREDNRISLTKRAGQPGETILSIPLSGSFTDELLDEYATHLFYIPHRPAESEKILPYTNQVYEATVEYGNSGKRTYSGLYDREGLPYMWPELMSTVRYDFTRAYRMDMLNSTVYGRRARRGDELMFVSVVFQEEGQEYTYLCRDESIAIGDRVQVPVGDDHNPVIATVTDIRWLPKEEAPYPLWKIKTVIGRDEEQDRYVQEILPPDATEE